MAIEDFGYDLDGKPIDFVDENGMKWVYQGKSESGADHWCGCY